ncbi:Tim10/DDP family zinc finger-domain-containing protein [Gilbertella persicaria]|uniref:Tim10/DDP family zinc finger-domain-containing protein n=1 Tax=Gilbertella persicaria TaxID=101096 RepID=UPI0022205719|nr:Tim10/DDP family zinc finger-domain-containing protein [Gilbertella persicaria]KAI8054938.1 Tim10/DDP family zinc finger-domain-containing protein [Gilbertella persicaria]
MSFFGAPSFQQQQQQQTINPQNIALAEQELELFTDLFNRITDSCHKKCISKDYAQADLTQGEAVCIDRCVSKYLESNTKVSAKMQQVGQQ